MASIRTSLSFFQFASRSENFRPRGEREKGAVLARMLMSDWQVIFLQSKANGGAYDGERFARPKVGLAAVDVVPKPSTLSTQVTAAGSSQKNHNGT